MTGEKEGIYNPACPPHLSNKNHTMKTFSALAFSATMITTTQLSSVFVDAIVTSAVPTGGEIAVMRKKSRNKCYFYHRGYQGNLKFLLLHAFLFFMPPPVFPYAAVFLPAGFLTTNKLETPWAMMASAAIHWAKTCDPKSPRRGSFPLMG